MTREEALTEIKERIHITEYVGSNYVDCVNIEALRMAIEALKNSERIAESSQNVSNDDSISRKEAIDAAKHAWAKGLEPSQYIEDLPSVHPKFPENWWKTDHGYMWLCPHCGLPAHSDFEECLRCGTKRPAAQPESHYCRECKWSRCRVNVDIYGNIETYWHCHNWDGATDEEGYCHEWERRTA